jgi:hypothetical protein
VTVALQIVPWLSYSVPGLLNLIILSTTWSISLYCYLLTVYTDPGRYAICSNTCWVTATCHDLPRAARCRVPCAWDPDVEGDSVVQEVKKKVGSACPSPWPVAPFVSLRC